MAEKQLDTRLKRQGKQNVIYVDARGKSYAAIVKVRTNGTTGDLMVRSGSHRVVSAAAKATTANGTGFHFR